MMSELEVKSSRYTSERIKEETEQIINESQDSLVKYFVEVFCYMKALQHNDVSMFDEIDQKIIKFLELAENTFSSEKMNPVLAITDMLNRSLFPLGHLGNDKGSVNIYQEVLNNNVLLPKSYDLKNAEEFGFNQRYLIPGSVNFNDIATKGLPSWVRLSTEDHSSNETQVNEERPSKYYPIAIEPSKEVVDMTLGWGGMEGKTRYEKYKGLQESYWQLRKMKLSGLTAKEYLMVQASNLFLNGRENGMDEEGGCLLMGSKITNFITGQISCPVGHYYKSDRPIDITIGQEYNLAIYSSSSRVQNLTMEPRFAIQLYGDTNE